MTDHYDVCIIGSGAGGGPVALTLAQAGYRVLVLEKGPWLKTSDYFKDEIACCRRSTYTPNLRDERHVIEEREGKNWKAQSTYDSGWDFWNGNVVGGSTNFMSGFFFRLKPQDFQLRSEFGPIKNANVADWPISYSQLEPYYTQVETEVGISGRVVAHPFAEPRSTAEFPYPPTAEHLLSRVFDHACEQLKLHAIPTPRAVLSRPVDERRACEYAGYCGSYGCATGAKGSARVALLDRAIKTGQCEIRPHAQVQRLISDDSGRVTAAEYVDTVNNIQRVRAKIFVVACQAVETARLLLLSTGPKHPQGLGNRYQQVGKNLIFSAGGSGRGEFEYADFSTDQAQALKQIGPFVNRSLQEWYFINEKQLGGKRKGGTIDFLLRHPNPISRAVGLRRDDNDELIWGQALKQRLKNEFTRAQYLDYEVFCDWLPTDDCFVSLDSAVKDKWGKPVAKIRLNSHPQDVIIGTYLSNQAKTVLTAMGAKNISGSASTSPPQNLMAGGCRFGTDPKSSVLDSDCRMHNATNLFVTDGSFMPTGGSVPFTWTIYANAFRVAEIIKHQL
ncbi:MAG: GMC family oxidoreductase [Gammaproteobacteria bacterium]|nr:GMC family oxidoreductase [Gammaproteobacteria bacterium]